MKTSAVSHLLGLDHARETAYNYLADFLFFLSLSLSPLYALFVHLIKCMQLTHKYIQLILFLCSTNIE